MFFLLKTDIFFFNVLYNIFEKNDIAYKGKEKRYEQQRFFT